MLECARNACVDSVTAGSYVEGALGEGLENQRCWCTPGDGKSLGCRCGAICGFALGRLREHSAETTKRHFSLHSTNLRCCASAGGDGSAGAGGRTARERACRCRRDQSSQTRCKSSAPQGMQNTTHRGTYENSKYEPQHERLTEPSTTPPFSDFPRPPPSKVEAFSVGLGPKLLSYRTAGGEGGFFKGKLYGPFSSSSDDEEEEVEPVIVEAKKPASFWAWGKKEEEKQQQQQQEQKKKKEAEGVEVR